MAAKKVDALEERLEGEMSQIKATVENRISSVEDKVSSLEDKVFDLHEMVKKILENQIQMAASETKGQVTFGYDIPKNPTRERQSYSPSTPQSDIVTPSPHQVAVTQFPTSVVTPKPVRPILPTHESNQGMPPTPSSRHLEHHPASFVGTGRGHHCGRDHPSLSNIRVAAPPYRSSLSLDGRPSIGSSFGSVTYDSPLGPTPSHLSQPFASPDLDLASVILIEKCIKKKSSPEPETKCIHFVDANDIADDEDFLEDETKVIKVDSLHDLNPELGSLEPLDLDTLIHPDPNLIKDIPLDKVCMDDINLIPKEAVLTLNTLKLNSEDSDLIVSPTKETSNNSDLILNNFDKDNLDLEVSQLDLLPELDPDLIDPKSIELRVMTKHDPIENTNMSLKDKNLKLKDFELNWNNEHSLVLLESILGVSPLDLHLKESVLPDWAYHITPRTDWNENISPRFHVVPTSNLDMLPRLLSPIPVGDSWGYVIMVESDDPSSYHTPDSYILPATSSSFPIKDHLSPSWLTLLDYTTATRRLSMTLVETSYRNALVAKDVFIAPPTPIPLNIPAAVPTTQTEFLVAVQENTAEFLAENNPGLPVPPSRCQGQSNFLSRSFQEPNSLLPCCPQPASLLSSRPESVLVAVRRRSGVAQLPEGTSSAAYSKPSSFLLLSRRPEDLQAPTRRFPSPEKLLPTLSRPLRFKVDDFDGNLPTIVANPYAWTKIASMIYLDWPIGTGFSYSRNDKDYFTEDVQAKKLLYEFLKKPVQNYVFWLLDHPRFLLNPFYMGGESYGGKMATLVAHEIVEGNEEGQQPQVNIKGYLVGNAITGDKVDKNSQVPHAYGLGIIPEELYKLIKKGCVGEDYGNPQNVFCVAQLKVFNDYLSEINSYSILDPKCSDEPLSPQENVGDGISLEENYAQFLTQPSIPDTSCIVKYTVLFSNNLTFATVKVWSSVRVGVMWRLVKGLCNALLCLRGGFLIKLSEASIKE
ncbi:hypothetical protein M5K25_005797 [Dendrobium thyrsiflorum]|uniref:Carboxypeptidase n=1 Tax=Dendrobium thyrsiflorum TaxID=117978 RepID=A0ABD0VQY5_DENTH